MAFNISDFTGNFQEGARPNLFQVRIPLIDQDLEFLAKATSLPGSTIGVIEVPYFGRMVKLAGNRTFAEWEVTILNDEDFKVRNILEQRMATINGHESNTSDGQQTLSTYAIDGDVVQYSRDGNVIANYKFVNMFPINIDPIQLDWGTNDTIEEYNVTFAYQYFTRDNNPITVALR